MADGLETQDVKDEKSKKEKKGSPLKMILIVVGILVVNAIIVIGVVKFFFANAGHDDHPKEATTEQTHKENDEFAEFKDVEETFFETENERKMISTGRITTNPSNSIKKFIIMDLGFEYRIKPDLPEEEFDLEKPLMQKMMLKLKAGITQKIGSMRVEELVRQRSELPDIFKEELQTLFNENKMYLREVYLNEFLIQ